MAGDKRAEALKSSIGPTEEKIYAGVLGKMIGVYLGLPVEGWSYDRIRWVFGEVDRYVHSEVGSVLIEPDDDLSGTFTFVRALEENDFPENITSRQIGDLWLDKVIEDKTIFWWGGLFRSTEHTAYLRLKAGIHAPDSGSMKLNGRTAAEQIGSQIFIDGWGLVNPGNPERAARMARAAAQVSHDGIAVSMAAWIAALEAIVFEESELIPAMRKANAVIQDEQVSALVEEMIGRCEGKKDWRQVRDEIEAVHPYSRYGGNCPIVTNFMAILMSLLMDEDRFDRAVVIAVSAGWDTDCNGGNAGCIEAVRLGLDNLESTAHTLRAEMNERLLVVNAEGGSVLQNASSLAKDCIAWAWTLQGRTCPLDRHRFTFDFPGSTHGCVLARGTIRQLCDEMGPGLEIKPQADDELSWITGPDLRTQEKTGYALLACPTVYPGQTLSARLTSACPSGQARLFAEQIDGQEQTLRTASQWTALTSDQVLSWTIPGGLGYPVVRSGIEWRGAETCVVRWIEATGNPDLRFTNVYQMSPGFTTGRGVPSWAQVWMDSTLQSTADHLSCFCLSHTQDKGLLTLGTRDWKDMEIAAGLTLSMQKQAGLVLHATGLRRFTAAVLEEGELRIVQCRDEQWTILASCPFPIADGQSLRLSLSAKGNRLRAEIDGQVMLEAAEIGNRCGAAGFLISRGTVLAQNVIMKGIEHHG